MKLHELHTWVRVTMLAVYCDALDADPMTRVSGVVTGVTRHADGRDDTVNVLLDSGEEILALPLWLNREVPAPITDPVALEEWLTHEA